MFCKLAVFSQTQQLHISTIGSSSSKVFEATSTPHWQNALRLLTCICFGANLCGFAVILNDLLIISIINVIIGSFASSFLHWSWLIVALNILRQSIFIHSTLDWYLEPGPHWQWSQALTRSNYLEKGTIFPPPPSPIPPSKCVHMYVSKFALKTFVLLVNGPLLIWLIGVIGVKYTLLIYWTPLCWFHSDIRFNVSHASQKNMIQPSRPCVLYYRNTGFDQQSGACLRSQ